jgi:MAF protein
VAILAKRKAMAVAMNVSQGIVLAADTLIDFEGTILGKPMDADNAFEMLQLLSGRIHEVLTGLAVFDRREGVRMLSVVSTKVRMRDYGDREVSRYVESGEPMDKAGSYAIQEEGGRLINSISGCYNNVIGLPLCETIELLRSVGLPLSKDHEVCRLPSGEFCPRMR